MAIVVYLGLIGLTFAGFSRVPPGFVPTQDKDYLVAFAQLPDAASLDRTEAVIRKMSAIALRASGRRERGGVSRAVDQRLRQRAERRHRVRRRSSRPRSGPRRALSAGAIVGALNAQFAGIQEAFVAIFPPPPVQGLGQVGGFKLYVEDRGERRLRGALRAGAERDRAGLAATPQLAGLFSSFQVNVPQIDADVDRERVKTYGVPLTSVFETLQVYLGSLYVNDFNRFGRTYQVNVQAESRFRLQPEQIRRLEDAQRRAATMVPLGSLADGRRAATGPIR